MMRITVDIVPHGDEDRKETVETVTIAQVARHDSDPGGVRDYALWNGPDPEGKPFAVIRHTRADGAAVLAGKAFAALVTHRS